MEVTTMKILKKDTLEQLKKLINEIDIEESKDNFDDIDIDIVTFNQYKIIDIVRELVK